ncbi:MAG: hypothetical protein LBP89_01970 [Helicobacteraceae bacterium]|jgi:hypothetical protein|nr:hypothetical protein [Helicobacteraceae bacterium]
MKYARLVFLALILAIGLNAGIYDEYMKDANKGGAFYQYSTIGFIENPNLEFILELTPNVK